MAKRRTHRTRGIASKRQVVQAYLDGVALERPGGEPRRRNSLRSSDRCAANPRWTASLPSRDIVRSGYASDFRVRRLRDGTDAGPHGLVHLEC